MFTVCDFPALKVMMATDWRKQYVKDCAAILNHAQCGNNIQIEAVSAVVVTTLFVNRIQGHTLEEENRIDISTSI